MDRKVTRTNKFSKITVQKVNAQKLLYFSILVTNNLKLKWNTVTFAFDQKYETLINLTICMQGLHIKHQKTFLRKKL